MKKFTQHVLFIASTVLLSQLVLGFRHNITLERDDRRNIPLSTFGFYKGGRFIIDIKNFSVHNPFNFKDGDKPPMFGFSLQSTKNDGVSSYMEKASKACLLQQKLMKDMKIIMFKFENLEGDQPSMKIERHGDKQFQLIQIEDEVNRTEVVTHTLTQWLSSHAAMVPFKGKNKCYNSSDVTNQINFSHKKASFEVHINCTEQEGLYNLYFHNCFNYANTGAISVDLEIQMFELNWYNYLSAGEIPLPIMYGFMSCSFLMAALVWTIHLHKQRIWTFKIHWLMAVVVYIKAISVAAHAVNYYFIGKGGLHVQTWAILFYIIHLLKGALLFTAILLIGTGYFFVKHVLSSKEKKIFLIVIPLQIIVNVAQIIIESTEEGYRSYKFWSEVTILVDLICCGAILLPVVWSIKHLTEAAKTDGKAAISLTKLKLFRQFYVMIVCYIYFTRIIVYLIKITVPFQYMWLDEFFTEAASYFFFVFTGYKFRPVNDNPYLQIPVEEDEPDIEMNDVSAHSSFGDRLTRVNKPDVRRT